MSKIKWGAIVVDGRGKLGGHVFTKTKSGATMRTKVTPVNPQTSAQASARSRLGGNSQGWGLLTEEQRETWQNRAKETSKTNIFGDQYFPSGKNLFTSVNNNLVMIGENVLPVAPEFFPLPFITQMSILATATPKSIVLDIISSGSVAGNMLVVEATKGFSPGKFNFDGSFRQIAIVTADGIPSATELADMYISKFGILQKKTKVAFRCYYINISTGMSSPRFSTNAIVM